MVELVAFIPFGIITMISFKKDVMKVSVEIPNETDESAKPKRGLYISKSASECWQDDTGVMGEFVLQ